MTRPGQVNPWAAWLQANGPGRYQLASKTGWDAFVNTAPRADLRVLTRAEVAALGPDELEDYTEARMVWNANLPTVKTHQLAAAFAVIDQVMASNRRDADRLRGSVVVDAAPGLGKTTIATRYAREFHRRVYRRHGPTTASGHQRLPVAFVPLSAGMTLKGLNQKILAFYGHPAANRASSARLGALAVDCVTSCETQLVVIDDLHFVDFRHRHGMEVSNHLKGLANEMPVTFIYVGVRLREKRFFDEGILGPDAVYAQTSRRATRCEVAPFDITTGAGMRGWTDLLHALEAHLKLADTRPGMLTDHARELHRRTQGHIASLTNLIDRACYLAITTGTETITAELLTATTTDNAAHTLSRTG
jgi:AAA domain